MISGICKPLAHQLLVANEEQLSLGSERLHVWQQALTTSSSVSCIQSWSLQRVFSRDCLFCGGNVGKNGLNDVCLACGGLEFLNLALEQHV